MVSAFERLKAFAASAAAPLAPYEARLKAETGLPVVWEPKRDTIEEAVTRHLLTSAETDTPAGMAKVFDQHFDAKTRTGTGYRTYRVVQSVIMADIEMAALGSNEDRIQQALKVYAGWWGADKADPAAAGCHARALITASYSRIAGQSLKDIDADKLQQLQSACQGARAVLDTAALAGRKHWLWRQADFLLSFVSVLADTEDRDVLLPAFAAVQTLDPHEFGIYDDRAIHLLQKWAGGHGAIEHFARSSVERTAAQFGELLYARIYDGVLASEKPDLGGLDTERFFRGFADWLQRFPSQALANRIAAHAHVLGEDRIVAQLFQGALTEIHPQHWFHDRQPLEAWRRVKSGQTTSGRVALR